MSKQSNPENDELYHQKIIEQYSKEEKAAEKSAETVVKTTKKKESATKSYLKAVEKALKEARDKEFRDIDFAHQMGYMSDEEYYNKLAILRDKHFEKGCEEWQKYTLKINKYQVQLVEKQKADIISLYDDISREAKKSITAVEKKQETLLGKLSGASPLATKHTSVFKGQGAGLVLDDGVWKNHEDFIVEEYRPTDFKAEAEKLTRLYRALSAVMDKGVSAEFWNQFTGLSADDMLGTANAILSMSDEEFSAFYSSWQGYQDIAGKTAYKMTQPDRESIIAEYGSLGDDLKSSLTEAFGNIPDTFYEYGKLSAEEFEKGFASRINTVQDFVDKGGSTGPYPEGADEGGGTDESDATGEVNNIYNFYGSDKTDGERLWDVMRFNEITRMRGE